MSASVKESAFALSNGKHDGGRLEFVIATRVWYGSGSLDG
jgi:hypothetical protein